MPYFAPIAPVLPFWKNFGNGATSAMSIAPTNSSWYVFPLIGIGGRHQFPGWITANTFGFFFSYGAGASDAGTSRLQLAIYTLNGSSLSLINSVSTNYINQTAATQNTSLYGGVQVVTIHSSQWSVAPVFEPQSQYWMAWQIRSAGNRVNFTFLTPYQSALTGWSGSLGGGSAAASDVIAGPFHGIYTASTVVPTSIAQSQVVGSGTRRNIVPIIRMDYSIPPQYF